MAERFGTLGSYRAVEIGHAVANDPALMDRMYDRLDRLGLIGDYQRLAGSWSYANVFADRDQANAAAGMALLLGYGEGERELTPTEQQMAREGGFGILSDAFGGPWPAGIVPGRNADLDGWAPGYGGVRAEVNAGNLRDPRAETSSLSGQVADHYRVTSERYDPTEVDRSHERRRGDATAFGHSSTGDVRSQKRDHYAQLLREQAMLPRPYPQIAADEIGGFLTKFSQSGALARAGLSGLAEDGLSGIVGRFGETLKETGDKWEALKAAGSGWQQARDVLIDTRMDQVRGYGLTDAQMDFFRATNETFFPAGVHDMLNTDASHARNRAREALVQAEGETGEHIAELLTRSTISQDDTYLRTIGAYNRANTGDTPVSPPLSQNSVSGGWSGTLLDLIALPESRGNYNAWYGNAEQDRVDLAGLTVDQVRGLQADLVRSTGGSAVGRYQLLDDTLDGLIDQMGLTGNERFTPELQDRMALQLARDAGMDDWAAGRISNALTLFRILVSACAMTDGRGSGRTNRRMIPSRITVESKQPGWWTPNPSPVINQDVTSATMAAMMNTWMLRTTTSSEDMLHFFCDRTAISHITASIATSTATVRMTFLTAASCLPAKKRPRSALINHAASTASKARTMILPTGIFPKDMTAHSSRILSRRATEPPVPHRRYQRIRQRIFRKYVPSCPRRKRPKGHGWPAS
jgi:conjugal transfer mating pair stabilization protein TraG